MKRKLLLSILLALFGLSINAQTTFQKIFGSTAPDKGYSVLQTSDSGYVFTGEWCYYTSWCKNLMYLIKTDQNGNALWTKFFPYAGSTGTAETVGYSVIQTSDNGFAVAGYNILYGAGLIQKMYLVRTNSNGDSLWSKTYGETYGAVAYSIKQTTDNGFILAGSWAHTASIQKLSLLKTNSNGDSLWGKNYLLGSAPNGIAHSVVEMTNGYALVGLTEQTDGSGNHDVCLIRTNSVGDTLWSKIYSGWNDDQGYWLQKTPDNGFIISGATLSFGTGSYDAYLIKTDSNGVLLWSKTYGGLDNEYGNYVSLTSDGGYIIAGSTESFSTGGFDVYLIKTDALGNQQWYKTFGGVNADYGYSVQQTFDGGYIIVGHRGNNIYLIKTDGNGNATGINEIDPSSFLPQMNISPNPFSSETTISTIKNMQNATLTIYNSIGKEIKSIKNITGQEIKLQRDNLANGLYFLRLTTDNKIIATDKLVISN